MPRKRTQAARRSEFVREIDAETGKTLRVHRAAIDEHDGRRFAFWIVNAKTGEYRFHWLRKK